MSTSSTFSFADRSNAGDALPAPHGYKEFNSHASAASSNSSNKKNKQSQRDLKEIKMKRAWVTAQSPSKSIFMNMFMAWMSGSSIGIFSIMIMGYMLYGPLMAAIGVNSTFRAYEDPGVSLLLPKLTFVALNAVVFCIGLYKAHTLNLIEVSDADWAIYVQPAMPTDQIHFSG
eukprot:TRINITY_DN8499_c0_g1_i1.p1 TRINITY_DN8499_c0_g1~~TRINITY_DN8499_c0_g1_i1.p1  ORF type:complete len:180 (-),score=45.01 TRINITY_DN8499_c0_g1_i1:49-567(-)